MIIKFLNMFNNINENLFEWFDIFVDTLPLFDWLKDAIIDSVHIIPLLFIVFFIIELIEYKYSYKITQLIKKSEKGSVIIGSLLAILPQCGFSIIASSLYLRRYITRGTLIAIYLATSDEAIPILLARPDKVYYIIPIIIIKLIVAIIAGYLVDLIFKNKYSKDSINTIDETGCCHHSISQPKRLELITHPIKHTLNIFGFILLITIALNFFIDVCIKQDIIKQFLNRIIFIKPVITSILGLIPNCAISVGLTMLLINGSLALSAVVAGLLSNAGLGILVLFKKYNNIKDTLEIILILLIISIFTGYLLQIFGF